MRAKWLVGMFVCLCGLSLFGLACDPGVETRELTVEELKERLRQGYHASASSRSFQSEKTSDERLNEFLKRLAPPKIAWAKMGKVERERHMARTVMPLMLLFFEEYDSRLSGGFTSIGGGRAFSCLSCHQNPNIPVNGPIDTRTFDFSSPSHLYPLDPNNLPHEDTADYTTARKVRFMKYVITPAMRILLGDDKVNCFTCHAKKH